MEQPGSPDLACVQRWMLTVVTHPDGVATGIESYAAQREYRVSAAEVETVIHSSQSQSSIERLDVYANAYQARLLEVLVGEYPALAHAIGTDVFVGLAAGFLQEHPPQSYTLADLGKRFPEYLQQTRPDRETPDDPDWADFLIDLARLERTYSEVFDGPGIEDRPPLKPEQLQSLSVEQWLATRFVPAPCLRLMTFRFPVHEYASSVRRQIEPDFPEAGTVRLAITRREYIVRRAALGELEFQVLSGLVAGHPVGEVVNLAAENHDGTVEDLAIRINEWFRNWSAAGYFIDIG